MGCLVPLLPYLAETLKNSLQSLLKGGPRSAKDQSLQSTPGQ